MTDYPTDRTPIYGGTPEPGSAAALWVGRFDGSHARVRVGPHAHHALQLLYVATGGGTHLLGDVAWDVEAGDVFLVPPGMVHDLSGLEAEASGWVVEFSAAAALQDQTDGGSLLMWRGNPLLNPFLAAELDPAVARLRVPAHDRERWTARFEAMERECDGAADGHREALAAWLQLLVVDVARLATNLPAAIRDSRDPVLADAFRVIDERFAQGISAKDVAGQLGFTTGHLSTLVRRRTGRTLQAWILERQMAEARRLLVSTTLPVQSVATRAGYDDAAYFSRRFRRHHGVAPSEWRDAGRRPQRD